MDKNRTVTKKTVRVAKFTTMVANFPTKNRTHRGKSIVKIPQNKGAKGSKVYKQICKQALGIVQQRLKSTDSKKDKIKTEQRKTLFRFVFYRISRSNKKG